MTLVAYEVAVRLELDLRHEIHTREWHLLKAGPDEIQLRMLDLHLRWSPGGEHRVAA